MGFTIRQRMDRNNKCVPLIAKVDGYIAPYIKEMLNPTYKQIESEFIDLLYVQYIDCNHLGIFTDMIKISYKVNSTMKLTRIGESVKRLFMMMGLAKGIEIEATKGRMFR